MVYYVHSNTRCPTCRAIELQARETVQTDFAAQLDRGVIVWKTINYEESATSELAAKFEIQMPVVVLARKRTGRLRTGIGWIKYGDLWATSRHLPNTYVMRSTRCSMLQIRIP